MPKLRICRLFIKFIKINMFKAFKKGTLDFKEL